jgi:Domain of unknown function (DUF4184)
MPITFFAHQLPVLSIASRRLPYVDGLTLTVGSMAPDFAYVFAGSPWAIESHDRAGVLTFCLPVTMIVSWIIARVLAPVVPDHLANLGSFNLRDFRGLATHRFGIVRSPVCAIIGATTHVLLDQFTHGTGVGRFAFRVIPIRFRDVFGHQISTFDLLQYGISVVFTLWSVYLLHAYGQARWLRSRAETIPRTTVTRRSRRWLFGTTAVVGFALMAVAPDSYVATTTTIIRATAALAVGLTIGAIATRWFGSPPSITAR